MMQMTDEMMEDVMEDVMTGRVDVNWEYGWSFWALPDQMQHQIAHDMLHLGWSPWEWEQGRYLMHLPGRFKLLETAGEA